MKRQLLTILGILCLSLVWSADGRKEFKEIVEPSPDIAFADATVKAICVENWDTDKDGELSEAEAAAVSNIGNVFVGNQDITSFEELRYFTGITTISGFGGCSKMNSVTIPANVKGIEKGTFYGCEELTSIEIPDGVESIGEIAFWGCTKLKSIDIPNSVTTIDTEAFLYCENLESVVLPNNVKTLNLTFKSCKSLKSIVIPNSVTTLYKTFFDCSSLSSVILPSGLKSIGVGTFYSCTSLESIEIPDGVTSIEYAAFEGCNELISVTMRNETPISISSSTFPNRANATLYVPAGAKAAYEAADYWKEFKEIVEPSPDIAFADATVKAICVEYWDTDKDGELSEAEAAAVTSLNGAFRWNPDISSFDELRYFTSLTEIEESAFRMTGLTSITLPNTVKSIGNFCFEGCTQLSMIIFGENLETIGWSAFHNCKSLENVSLPYSVKDIYGSAFNGCSGLKIMDLSGSLESIGELAFADCTSLESIIIPAVLTNIESDSFYGCDGLTSIKVEDGNPALDSRDNCNAVIRTENDELIIACKSTVIPETVRAIGKNAFGGLKELREITLPASIERIGAVAFYGCDNLQDVRCQMGLPCTVDETAFLTKYSEDNGYTFTTATLHVPVGSVANYKEADVWKEFGTILEEGTVLTETDGLYCDNISIHIGYSSDLTVNLSNENSFSAYQFDLQLPEGITLAKDDSSNYIVSKSDRYSDNSQQIKIEEIGDNTFRFVSVSLQDGVINGNDGAILMASIKASEDVREGTLNAAIKNIVLTTADETKMIPDDTSFSIITSTLKIGDANGSGNADANDIADIVNYMMHMPTSTGKFDEDAADLNGDGIINTADIVLLVKLLLGE